MTNQARLNHSKIGIISWSWRTPLGITIEDGIRRLLAGECAARPHRFNSNTFECQWSSPILTDPLPTRHGRFLKRMARFAVETTIEAFAAADLKRNFSPEQVGLFLGYGGLRVDWDDMMPALASQNEDGSGSWHNGLVKLHPFWILRHLSNNAQAIAAEEIDAHGEGVTFGGGNAGAQALVSAISALRVGAIDRAVVVAYDSLIEPEILITFKPDCVPGEAAAALVLERFEVGNETPLAFIEAAESADGQDGEPHATCIENCIQSMASGGEVLYGTEKPHPDFKCTKRAMGHLGSATSIVQIIALAEMLKKQKFGKKGICAGIAVSTGTPGLAAAVRVEVPDEMFK